LQRNAHGFDVQIDDASERLGSLALQGPASRTILQAACGDGIAQLKFFAIAPFRVGGVDVLVSRTGYTGDLGYEIWVPREQALKVWDAIMAAGQPYLLQPAGLDAMDVTRIEAGFVLNGVDYFSAPHCPIESRKSTPFEIGLGWTVKLDREPFIGQAALLEERARGSKWAKVGLMIDWDEYEALFAAVGLPPNVPSAAWRTAIPVFDTRGRQIGQATSGAWSPILKQNLALASIESTYARPGSRLRIEVTVEYHRKQVTAVVAATPFFDPERKRA
jgi:aminomethyltransferase